MNSVSELIPHKNYILQFKTDFNNSIFLGKDSFKFLDSYLNKVNKLKEQFNEDSLSIFNYLENSKFYVNKYKAQTLLDEMYFDYYFNFFFQKHSCCSTFLENLKAFFYKMDDSDDIDDEKIIQIYKIIIISLKYCIKSLLNRSVSKSDFFLFLKEKMVFIPNKFIDEFCFNILKLLFSSNIIENLNQNDLRFCDDCFFIDLYLLSIAPVKIYNNDAFDQKYSCYYNSALLSFSVKKFLNTRNFEYFEYFDTRLKVFFEDYFDLNLNNFYYLEKQNHLIYDIIKIIYIDKVILNDFVFNSIIISCFDVYYFSERQNILHDKSGNFVFRFIP